MLKRQFFGLMMTEKQTCAYSSEGLNDHPLVIIGACGSLKNVEENLLEEHLHTEGPTLQSETTAKKQVLARPTQNKVFWRSSCSAFTAKTQQVVTRSKLWTVSNRIIKCRQQKGGGKVKRSISRRWRNVTAHCEKPHLPSIMCVSSLRCSAVSLSEYTAALFDKL